MFTISIIVYVVVALIVGPLWPLEFLGGKAGPLGLMLVLVWGFFLIWGIIS